MSTAQATYRAIHNLKAKYHFFKFVKNPTNTSSIFDMTNSFQKAAHPELVKTILKPLLENSQIKNDYENRYWPAVPSFTELKNFPTKSFGREAANFFESYQLQPDFYPAPDFSTPQNYITSRIYQAHDFWHVLTGYDTTLEHELALQAFGVGQYKQPISLTIIAGGLLNLLRHSPEKSGRVLELISQGFNRGMKAQNLLTAPVLERLGDPVEQVRKDLQIENIFV